MRQDRNVKQAHSCHSDASLHGTLKYEQRFLHVWRKFGLFPALVKDYSQTQYAKATLAAKFTL